MGHVLDTFAQRQTRTAVGAEATDWRGNVAAGLWKSLKR